MDFRVLGPLEVAGDDGTPLALGGPKQRALLAVLLLNANEVVSSDRLMLELWGDDPPATAPNTLQVYVSQLRRILRSGRASGGTDDVIVTQRPGYLAAIAMDDLDAHRFQRLADSGRDALRSGQASEASVRLRECLALWHGPALADFRYEEFAQAAAEALDDRRLIAIEDRIEADLELGRAAELIPELEALLASSPTHERLLLHLMIALYRSGRQEEALTRYQQTVERLVDDLGIDPAPSTQALYAQILRHDPALQLTRAETAPKHSRPEVANSPFVGPVATDVKSLLPVIAIVASLRGMETIDRAMQPDEASLVRAEVRERIADEYGRHGLVTIDGQRPGVAGYIGVATQYEDAAERTVAAARRALVLVQELAVEIKFAWGIEGPTAAMGMASGRAVVERGEREPVLTDGDPMPLAVTLSDRARAGSIVVASGLSRRLEGHFILRPIKGGQEASELIAPRLGRPAPPSSPLIGRARERSQIAAASDELLTGRGGVLLVRGDVGSGKTRMLAELRDGLPDDVLWLEGRCTPYGDETRARPFPEILRGWAGIGDADSDLTAKARFRAQLVSLNASLRPPMLAALMRLAGLRRGGGDSSSNGKHLDDIALEAFSVWLGALASTTSVALAVEDVHSADALTRRVLEAPFIVAQGRPLLNVVTAGPDTSGAAAALWRRALDLMGSRIVSIELTAFNEEDARSLIDALSPAGVIDPDARTEILARSGGNPLYIEQLVLTLAETNGLEREGETITVTRAGQALPSTLEGVLVVRIEGLPEPARDVARLGAVIGRSFSFQLLEAAYGRRVADPLAELLRADIIKEDRRSPDVVYRFRHGLLREAALSTLTQDRARRAHARVAAAIRAIYERSVADHLEVLATHEYLAGDTTAALADLEAAIERAAGDGDVSAIHLCDRAGRLAAKIGDVDAGRRIERLRDGILAQG